MKQWMNRIGEWWCVRMHDAVMWPAHGKYRCRTCFREYAVEFEGVPQRGANRPSLPLSGWVATRRA